MVDRYVKFLLWWTVSPLSHVCPLVQLSLSCARPLYCFPPTNCLRLKSLIHSTDCAVHCCHVHYGYCRYQNYCILNTVPQIAGIVHATAFRIVHWHFPLASLWTEISVIFLCSVHKTVQVCTVDCWWSVHFFASLWLVVRLLIVSLSAKMWCHHCPSSWIL